jgi:alpha-ribazole phosphatase
MRAILVRHGQTDWNEGRIFRGRIDVELNDNGREQARVIGERLASVELQAVYSSPLRRATETAEAVASLHGLPVRLCDELIDIDFGEWQGLGREEARERYRSIYRVWEETPERVEIPGAESLSAVRERLESGLQRILEEHPDDTVALVSHGLTNKVLLCMVLGLDNSHFWKVKQDNGAINLFKYTATGSKLVLLNDTSHLRPIDTVVESMKSLENPLG